jgi:pimeloyl-ACP methyl ester carboxylesterase
MGASPIDNHATRSRFVDTPGLRVHFLEAGSDGEAEPVVMLHGFPQTSYQWRHQLAALASAGHPAYAPDNRGFGRTDKPRIRISRALLANDVVRFCDALGVERCMLVGHDWGGVIAFKAAVDYPERFTRLALLDTVCTVGSAQIPHPYWFKAYPLPEAFLAAYHREFIELFFGGGDGSVLRGWPGSQWVAPSPARGRPDWLDEEAVQHYVDAYSDPDVHFAAIQYYRYALPFHRVFEDPGAPGGERYESLSEQEVAAIWLHPKGFDAPAWHSEQLDFGPEDRHKRYHGPALFMYSERFAPLFPHHADGAAPGGDRFADQFAHYLVDLRVRFVQCGHFLPEEEPEIVSEALLDLHRR